MVPLDICEPCYKSLPINELACSRCAIPLPVGTPASSVCGQCLQHAPPYDRCIALWQYQAPADYFILRLKFNQKLMYARLMAELFAAHLSKIYANQEDKPEVVIPVPLHPTRMRERGFNQAAEIAKVMALRLHIPLLLHACQRAKNTLPQSELPANQRQQNVKGAFQVKPGLLPHHVAIVDDVMTTGHTVGEMTKTLKNVGVKVVDVWVCARANFR